MTQNRMPPGKPGRFKQCEGGSLWGCRAPVVRLWRGRLRLVVAVVDAGEVVARGRLHARGRVPGGLVVGVVWLVGLFV